ncbi:MAG: M20/M25/M40 family metallo-hydrolase, partial [Pseudomonadota bacterium]
GADNGIGLALAVATMMDPDLEHGPVTILVTVDEETGMTGVKTLDPRLIPETGILINLDSEEGSVKICIGCAGSADTVASFPIGDREALPEGYTLMDLELKGFPGGHSGVEIHDGRGNAIKSMADLLSRLQEAAGDLRLVKIGGGEKRNAIPSKARATIAVPGTALANLDVVLKTFVDELKRGEEVPNPDVTGELLGKNAQKVEASLIPTESVELIGALSSEFKARLLGVIADTPTGPFSSAELPNVGNLVTLSNNLAIVATEAESVDVTSMTRGADIEELRAKLVELREMWVSNGASLKEEEEPTSGWLEDPTQSTAVSIVTEAVRKAAGSAEWMAYHAGLEAGIVTGKAKGEMSAVAIGPRIKGAHTPQERVELQSVFDELVALREIFAQVVGRTARAE